MAESFVRFDFKLLLIIWLIAALINAVLKLADAPNVYVFIVILYRIVS